jgi:hypothetical protein
LSDLRDLLGFVVRCEHDRLGRQVVCRRADGVRYVCDLEFLTRLQMRAVDTAATTLAVDGEQRPCPCGACESLRDWKTGPYPVLAETR